MTITTLVITHEHGVDVYPCATPEIADAYLYDFVKHWWADQFDDDPMPTDKEAAIDEYFTCDLCLDSYEINTDTVLETPPAEEETPCAGSADSGCIAGN